MTLFGNRDFVCDWVNMGSLEWTRIQYNCVFIKRGNLNMETVTYTGKTACEDEGGVG